MGRNYGILKLAAKGSDIVRCELVFLSIGVSTVDNQTTEIFKILFIHEVKRMITVLLFELIAHVPLTHQTTIDQNPLPGKDGLPYLRWEQNLF